MNAEPKGEDKDRILFELHNHEDMRGQAGFDLSRGWPGGTLVQGESNCQDVGARQRGEISGARA